MGLWPVGTSMTSSRATARAILVGLSALVLLPVAQYSADAAGPTAATSAAAAPTADDVVSTLGDVVPGFPDLDLRGKVRPTARQKAAASHLGAVDVRWNDFGSPASILPVDGVLRSGYSKKPAKAPAAARSWLKQNAAVFGLSRKDVKGLELVNNQSFANSEARAVLFRQRFGSLSPALDSMVTVGVARGRVYYVSSSITRAKGTVPAAKLSPLQGWLAAAASVGKAVSAADVDKIDSVVSPASQGGWTRLGVPGLAQQQQARLRALAMADGTVRPVIEANVIDVQGGSAAAYTVMVDAVTGKVLHRQNQVDNENSVEPFQGTLAPGTPGTCGPKHPFTLNDGNTKTITALGTALNPANDIVVKIFDPSDSLLTSQDTGTSPEPAVYTHDPIPAGTYSAQVCLFDSPTVPPTPPYNYGLVVTTSDQGAGGATPSVNPRWRLFPSNPSLDSLGSSSPTNSVVACWSAPATGCNYSDGPLANPQAPGPWDTVGGSGVGTGTTIGNNANTHEAWASPLTPGGLFQAPVAPDRQYVTEFKDKWNNSQCDPTQLVPEVDDSNPKGNDIRASVTDLFVNHNRMHDYSYYLGFTEQNYNLQSSNLGRGGVDGDPEVGNAQAGALSGAPYATGLGRDNANQITLQDGVPGITNQYLFQPIAGAFYAPCTDGALDFGIVGHEYTHAISNRMIGGPDEGITSEQGGAMGESWSDLNAAEYQFSHGYSNGGNVWAVGVYATQNPDRAIRDFAINKNPLNYSDYGFDTTGPEVHADGEIWNGTQWEVRQALVDKYDKIHPYDNANLQRWCSISQQATGPRHASTCPGNRRWIQLVFDAFLLQQGATSMLDARDAMIASDRMRFRGKDVKEMWGAFARRGMGATASVKNADDTDPVPSFATPTGQGKNVAVTFKGKGNGTVYIGRYEARATPAADLNPATALGKTLSMTPGTYEALYVSPTRGFTRFDLNVKPVKHGKKGKKTRTQKVKIKTSANYAAAAGGASVIGATAGSRNPSFLIDGTEATNWGGVTTDNVDVTTPSVAVDLAGSKARRIKQINVSAYLTPAPASGDELPLFGGKVDDDPDSGSRFTALRQFALEVCSSNCSSPSATWTRVFTSSPDAFPATLPRPVSPDLTLRSFAVGGKKGVKAAAVRLVALENQCTGYAGYAGEQDNDPLNDTDCKTASDRGTIVHAAELQVFGQRPR
jgi:hypothetical protein